MITDETHGATTPPLGTVTVDCPRSTPRWRSSNDALARLLARHRPGLAPAAVMARRIRHAVDTLVPAMTALCRRTCRFCPDPCCINHTVWFDFRDLLLFHLLDEPIPARQAATEKGEPCPYLTGRGCRLPWRMRPWMCLSYVCPAQLAILKNEERSRSAIIYNKINRIGNYRLRMEAAVLDRITRRRRTWPSSSSARPQ